MKRLIILALICALCALNLTACSEPVGDVPAGEAPAADGGEEPAITPIADDNPGYANTEQSMQIHENDFELTLHTDKIDYSPDEVITIWAAFEYTGEQDSVEIFHSSEYLVFTIVNQDGVYYNAGIVNDIGLTSVLEKNIPYRHEFKKSGAWDGDDPKAEYWTEFYKQPELRLPEGVYTIAAHVDFAAAGEDYMSTRVNFSTELQIVVNNAVEGGVEIPDEPSSSTEPNIDESGMELEEAWGFLSEEVRAFMEEKFPEYSILSIEIKSTRTIPDKQTTWISVRIDTRSEAAYEEVLEKLWKEFAYQRENGVYVCEVEVNGRGTGVEVCEG